MTRVADHSPVLGTVVQTRIDAPEAIAGQAEHAILAEFSRLDAVFSTYRSDSELSRWALAGGGCSAELTEVLIAAEYWWQASRGAFHPAIGAFRALWLRAAERGEPPAREALAALADSRPLPFRVVDGRVRQVGDCSGVDLNALAKGYIVDQAVAAGMAVPGVSSVVVNAGGDLVHAGAGRIEVGIEDPSRPYDNLPPRWRTSVENGALATSGLARRGFRVSGTWFGHVIDPRTGLPVEHTASVSVRAPQAMDADALATICGVLPAGEALAFLADRDGCECLIVDDEGGVHASPRWFS
ncbi:MAG: FAD:protein FMN transferase [Propionicimonas sp.]